MVGRHRVTTVLGIGLVFAWGTTYYLLAILAMPIAADTGWPLPWIIGGLTLGSLVAGMVSVRIGRAIDRHGGRPVMSLGTAMLALGLCLLAVAPSLPVYLLGWVVLGAAMAACLYDAAFSTLGRIFGQGARTTIATVTLWAASPARSAGRSRQRWSRRSAGAVPASPMPRFFSSSSCRFSTSACQARRGPTRPRPRPSSGPPARCRPRGVRSRLRHWPRS